MPVLYNCNALFCILLCWRKTCSIGSVALTINACGDHWQLVPLHCSHMAEPGRADGCLMLMLVWLASARLGT